MFPLYSAGSTRHVFGFVVVRPSGSECASSSSWGCDVYKIRQRVKKRKKKIFFLFWRKSPYFLYLGLYFWLVGGVLVALFSSSHTTRRSSTWLLFSANRRKTIAGEEDKKLNRELGPRSADERTCPLRETRNPAPSVSLGEAGGVKYICHIHFLLLLFIGFSNQVVRKWVSHLPPVRTHHISKSSEPIAV